VFRFCNAVSSRTILLDCPLLDAAVRSMKANSTATAVCQPRSTHAHVSQQRASAQNARRLSQQQHAIPAQPLGQSGVTLSHPSIILVALMATLPQPSYSVASWGKNVSATTSQAFYGHCLMSHVGCATFRHKRDPLRSSAYAGQGVKDAPHGGPDECCRCTTVAVVHLLLGCTSCQALLLLTEGEPLPHSSTPPMRCNAVLTTDPQLGHVLQLMSGAQPMCRFAHTLTSWLPAAAGPPALTQWRDATPLCVTPAMGCATTEVRLHLLTNNAV
jgi:hypothetical protein